MPLDVHDFSRDSGPNQALYKIADTLQENKRYQQERDYRHQKDEEADAWRKMNMIQDLTDLSKHQTSNDVANSVGNQKAAEILQKYTAAAKNLSPSELQGKITQEMSGVINGLDGLKNELDMSEAQLKALKQRFPTLNTGELAQVHRQDILHRRMDGSMNFVNPMQVAPSQVDLNNLEFLSNFVTGNKTLTDAIISPKGVEKTSVLMGTPDSHTTFSADMPHWKTPNFDPAKNKDGYYTGKEIPQLKIKGSELPSDAMPASNGKPFKVIDQDVYDRFAQDDGMNMELIAATRVKFPQRQGVKGYDDFSPTEKELAKRNVLYSNIEALDQTNFHPTGGTKPARTTVRVNTGAAKEMPTWDLSEYESTPEGGKDLTVPFQGYKVTAIGKETLLAKRVVYNPDSKKFTVTEYVGRDSNGDPTGEKTTTVNAKTFRQNIQGMNPGTDMKPFDALINQNSGGGTPKPREGTSMDYKVGGKVLTYDQIHKGAKKYNMTVEEYLKSIGAQ